MCVCVQHPWNRGDSKNPLLDFRFLEQDVLANDRIILANLKLLGRVSWVFLGYIEIPGFGCANEPDLNGCWLGHSSWSRLINVVPRMESANNTHGAAQVKWVWRKVS